MGEVREPYGRVKGRTEETKGVGNPNARATRSTNMDPRDLPETKPPIRVSLRPPGTYVAEG